MFALCWEEPIELHPSLLVSSLVIKDLLVLVPLILFNLAAERVFFLPLPLTDSFSLKVHVSLQPLIEVGKMGGYFLAPL